MTPADYAATHDLWPKDERRALLRTACAIAHGPSAHLSEAWLVQYVYEHGLPPREERERMKAARGAGEDTA